MPTRQIARILGAIAIVAGLFSVGVLTAGAEEKMPWQTLYAGEEATGEKVIGLWQFNPGAEAKDNSGNGHDLTLRGKSGYAAGGLFGACLESFGSGAENDAPHGAFADNDPRLSPLGAFTIEMWIKPKPEMDMFDEIFLLDKKYIISSPVQSEQPDANYDYCLYLRRRGIYRCQFRAHLGFGKDSAGFESRDVTLKPGKWYHVAFTYDGAGTGNFFLNGTSVGGTVHAGRGSVVPGKYPLVIGDRCGSIHEGFPGFIDQVRLSKGVVPFNDLISIRLADGARSAFVRMEKNAGVPLVIKNDSGGELTGVTVSLAGSRREIPLAALSPGEAQPGGPQTVQAPVDTTVCPGSYTLVVEVSAAAGAKDNFIRQRFPIVIVRRPLPHTMPVMLWGSHPEIPDLKQIGFTHRSVPLGNFWSSWRPLDGAMLDRLLVEGLGAVATWIHPGRHYNSDMKYRRIDRDGKPYEGRVRTCVSFPEIQNFGYNVGASVAKAYGHYPALKAALINTEDRDSTQVCFHEHDKEAFRKYSGYDIPAMVHNKSGVLYSTIKDFPKNRIIPDDDHILNYYRWFWKEGDGWNPLHTQVHKGLKSTGRADLLTFFDPAVRAPSLWGSAGELDAINHWNYTYPDPIKFGQTTDEMFAMAAGAARPQKVIRMTQMIWYRSEVAPNLPEDESKRAPWEKGKNADARFITVAPDHLRETFWCKISRPVSGIMYFGYESLRPTPQSNQPGGFRFTNPETAPVLTELIHDVVKPLGPMLLQVPDRQADVALLESFASQVFAHPGIARGVGAGDGLYWQADMHLILQWAGIQPRIVYDETILRDGLDEFRVLVMPDCDVLTEPVVKRILEFQRRGGLVVADQFLAPAIMPDILLPSRQRSGKADKDKAVLLARAAALRQELDPFYRRYSDSSNPEVVTRVRRYGSTDYLFAVNDRREYGDYVGGYGLVMEKGLPSSATLSLDRPGGYVYDLVDGKAMTVTQTPEGLAIKATFKPGGGRLFMITEKKIAGVRIEAPSNARLGKQLKLDIAVVDKHNKAIDAVLPMSVEIEDPENRRAEFSGYYGAKDGKLTLVLDLARNDLAGQWTITVSELASGLSRKHTVRVEP